MKKYFDKSNFQFLEFLSKPKTPDYHKLDEYITPIDKEVRSKNGSLNIAKVLGDHNIIFIVMYFSSRDGTKFTHGNFTDSSGISTNYFFDPNTDSISFNESFSYATNLYLSNQVDENTLRFVYMINTDYSKDDISGSKAHIRLGNLQCFKDNRIVDVIEGSWNISFDLEYKKLPHRIHRVQKKVAIYEGDTLPLRNIYLSPISINLEFISNLKKNIFQTPIKLCINQEDLIDTQNQGAFIELNDEKFYLIRVFDEIIDINNITSIEIMGKKYEFRTRKI